MWALPDWFPSFGAVLQDVAQRGLNYVVQGLIAVLVVAAGIWTTAIVWRKFKEATNKV